jgi:anti-repressor protein
MDKLINIQDNKDLGQAVSALELYSFLGYNSTQWKRWYTINITENKFAVEGDDYIGFDMMSKTSGGRPSKEFALSIDFAKKLSMLSRTEKGEIARNYFLEMERLAKAAIPELSRLDLLRMALEAEERTLLLEQEVKVQAPKVLYFDKVLDSKTAYATTLIAKELGMGAVTLNKILQKCGIQHKVDGSWVLYSKYQNKGFTNTKTYTFTGSDGRQRTSMQTVWTEKGRFFIHQQVNSHQIDNLISKD